MSPPLLGVEGQVQCNVSLMASSASVDCIPQNGSGLKERNYLRLSDCSSVDSSSEKNKNLNLKATELRLGLPGSQSPERDSDISLLDEKQLFPLVPYKDGIYSLSGSGNKRGFEDTVDGDSESKISKGTWMMFNSDAGQPKLAGNDAINTMLLDKTSGTHSSIKTEVPEKGSQECNVKINGSNTNSAPAAKAQVVGWPPIRSFRKNSLATTSKNDDEVDGTPALFVKVSMDGAPYLRKVDLRTYSTYQQLSSALQKMFTCFTIGQCGSEYVVTYEDKDGDWMLVGDVPWKMFTASCKRLKIMKGSDAIGLAPRAMEKSKNQN